MYVFFVVCDVLWPMGTQSPRQISSLGDKKKLILILIWILCELIGVQLTNRPTGIC